jgi:hypothetical protein
MGRLDHHHAVTSRKEAVALEAQEGLSIAMSPWYMAVGPDIATILIDTSRNGVVIV